MTRMTDASHCIALSAISNMTRYASLLLCSLIFFPGISLGQNDPEYEEACDKAICFCRASPGHQLCDVPDPDNNRCPWLTAFINDNADHFVVDQEEMYKYRCDAQVASNDSSPLDDLQHTGQAETVESMVDFIAGIAKLDTDVQTRLLKARLPEKTMLFVSSQIPQKGKHTGYMKYEEDGNYWFFSSRSSSVPITSTESANLKITVKFVPPKDAKEWLDALLELGEYSGSRARYEVEYGFQGRITSFEFKSWSRYNRQYRELALTVVSVRTTHATSPHIYGDDLEEHTRVIKQRTKEWIRYHMGKGDEQPQELFDN